MDGRLFTLNAAAKFRHEESMVFFPRLKRRAVKIAKQVDALLSGIVDNVCVYRDNRSSRNLSLLILDDFFPGVLSAFRIAEYNHYLENIAQTEVHSTCPSNLLLRNKSGYQEKLREYSHYYPEHQTKIRKFSKRRIPSCRVIYAVFINNIYSYIEYVDRHQIPFAFTLYPGGGFNVNDADADMKLARVFSSPNFKKVFVTQKITQQYLLEKKYCDADDIVFIYGCVLPSEQLSRLPIDKSRFKVDKNSLDICFVAFKYTERGVDKGYDVFIEVAKRLCEIHQDIRFHVVGSFEESDIDVSSIKDRIVFHGLRNTDFFPEFYSKMDIILSPNVPFVLAPGAFDGFPTGSCMEAGLCGVAVFCSDPLDQNIAFTDKEEIVIISREPREVAQLISHYYENPEALYQVAEKGKRAFLKTLDLKTQMAERMKVLEQLLNQSERA
jgi:glycosyltransferase involved in cell wall biosynthesis